MIRKRTIISLIITIIILIASNKTWLVFKPFSVDFDISGQGECNIKVELNKKDNDEFKKIKAEEKDLNIDNVKHVHIDVKRAKRPKRLRIIISDIKNFAPITIKNIQLNNKFKINDLTKMDVEGADLVSQERNKIVLTPAYDVTESSIIISYPQTLRISSPVDFHLEIFIIIAILTFLFSYKLSNYTADFNTIHKYPKSEIIFLSIFFVFLFIPMSNIDKSEISRHENRTLSKLSSFVNHEGQFNFKFPREFDAWFNDRFNMRENLIEAYNFRFILNRNWKTKDVLKGKDNWLFLAWKESKDSYTNQNLFTPEELQKFANYLDNIDKFCKIHNKHFYFFIAPDKARIYSEYYPEDIQPVGSQSLSMQLIDYLSKNTDVKIIYPKDKLISSKGKDLLYFKHDTHWNSLGAYIGYLELMKEIKKDYKDINVYTAKEYTIEPDEGGLYKMTPKILKKYEKLIYKMPKADNLSNCKNQIKNSKDLIVCYNKNSNVNAIIYRDSFTFYMMPYYTQTFKKASYVWKYEISTDAIKDADVVVLEIVERYLPTVKYFLRENSNAV